jgi:hypothetical protein
VDLLWIAEMMPGVPDEVVLAECVGTRRTLLTFDKDFGELAYGRGLPADCGIILFRVGAQAPGDLAALVVAVIRSQNSWAGLFGVVTGRRVRVRPIRARRADGEDT